MRVFSNSTKKHRFSITLTTCC